MGFLEPFAQNVYFSRPISPEHSCLPRKGNQSRLKVSPTGGLQALLQFAWSCSLSDSGPGKVRRLDQIGDSVLSGCNAKTNRENASWTSDPNFRRSSSRSFREFAFSNLAQWPLGCFDV